jgi:hypothetical protein
MPKQTRAETQAAFDKLVDELGEPEPVRTHGPTDLGVSDQLLSAADLGMILRNLTVTGTTTVRTKRQAIEWGRNEMRSGHDGWAGLCLMFVRSCYGLEALYPDAWTAWQNAAKRHHADPDEAPRGYAGFFRGGDHGHIVLLLGAGRCLTNDTGAPGTINVARLTDIEAAWGYRFQGWTEDLNGEVAPAPRSSSRPRLDRAFRLKLLRQALVRARQQGKYRRAQVLRAWIQRILDSSSR